MMIEMVGKKFGRLTVVALDRLENHKTYWKCVCDCGLTVVAVGNNLRSGNTSSCGCLRRETASARGKKNTVHGEGHDNKTRLYSIWCGMRQRCMNKNHHAFALYGGKGVSVCDEWNNYPAFKEWALSHGYTDNLSIDRIDPNDGYRPENCRWITISENVARANKNHKSRKLIRGEDAQECAPAATHSGRARTAISHHEAGALIKGEKIC